MGCRAGRTGLTRLRLSRTISSCGTEWDPAKDALNKRKHGYSLAQGAPALEDANKVVWIDDRFDYGEERVLTLGLNQQNVLFVVSTVRVQEVTRIISVRKAKRDEERIYFRAI